jgi:hypothetical protein
MKKEYSNEFVNWLLLERATGRERTRMKVRIRDNFTCQDCGKRRTPEDLWKMNSGIKGILGRKKLFDVHHINGDCGKKSKSYESADVIDGLITLCHKCHYNRPEHRCQSEDYGQFLNTKKRNIKMKKLASIGVPLSVLGKKYKITRQRVSQICKGVTFDPIAKQRGLWKKYLH